MLLGILADSHNQLERTRRAVALLHEAGAAALVHCGDLASPEIVEVCAVLPLYFVFGNHDGDMARQLKQAAIHFNATCLGWGGVIELAGKKIGIAHGHLTMDIKPILASSPDYLLTGHSHATHDVRDGTLRRINPGALHRASTFTVALLDLQADVLEFREVV